MKSQLPKVLHQVCGRPMLGYVLDLVKAIKSESCVTVVGYKHEEVAGFIAHQTKVAIQKDLKGTADAVKCALPLLKRFSGTVLILYGDIPLLTKETVRKLIKRHKDTAASATILTATIDKPSGYGRILRDERGSVCGIVEEKDADDFHKEIKEINTGIICFNKKSLVKALEKVRPNNRKKEYYLTDCIGILYNKGALIESLELSDFNESLGVNSRLDLSKAQGLMQRRINERLMLSGITMVDPKTVFASFDARIGEDTVIYPFTVIEKNVTIGANCVIGPFIRVRQGTILKDKVTVGNFLEISRSVIGSKSQAKHFGFIGDSRIGKHVNIGAGTVTANYDGKNKNSTVIRDGAFIGCDTVLIAPVSVGNAAKTGAGSVVTRNTVIKNGLTVAGVPARPLKKNT